jgi:hypothetical protein
LSDQDIAALLSLTEYLKWPTRWVKNDGDVDRDTILKFIEGTERRLMSGCCDDNMPIQYRYSIEGVLQRSLNGGTTWVDAPEYDPRVYSSQYPPLAGADGTDKKCAAATGAALLIKEQVGDQLADSMSRNVLNQLITDWVKTYLQTSNPFIALVTVISNLIFSLVIATLRPALTSGVYDQLKCILYCNIGDDATVSDAQWSQIRADILSDITGIAGIFLEHLIYLLGTMGTTNMLRAGGASSGDCSACSCGGGTCALDFNVDEGTLVSNDGYYVVIDAAWNGTKYVASVTRNDFGVCCTYLNFETLSGGQNEFQAWRTCDNVLHTGSIASLTQVYYLAFTSTVAFRVKVAFGDA